MNDREHEDDFEVQTDTETTAGSASAGGSPDDFRILEAVLFASDELLTPAHLKTILPSQPDARKIRSMVEKINVQLQKERHPFEVVEIGGGYQFRTITYYHPWVRQIFKEKAAKKLSIQALECLAIIAYKQPISKAEIEMVRGVVSDGAMKTLLEKRLVTIAGRSDKPGRPLLYGTTQTFLKYFGLNRKEDLPRIEEFEAMAREKMEGLSIDDLEQEEIDMKVDAVDDGAAGGAVEVPLPLSEASSLFEVELTGDTSVPVPAIEETAVDIETMSVEDTQPVEVPQEKSDAGDDEVDLELSVGGRAGEKSDPGTHSDGAAEVADALAEAAVAALPVTPVTSDTAVFEITSRPDHTAEDELLEVERPTVKMSAVAYDHTHSPLVDSQEIAEFELESEPGKVVEKPEVIASVKDKRDTVGAATPEEKAPVDATLPVSGQKSDEPDLPPLPEATEVELPVKKKKKKVHAPDVENEEPEDLFELETTVANLAEIEKGEDTSRKILEMDDDVFDFEASLIPVSEDEQKGAARVKKEESLPHPDLTEEAVAAPAVADWEPEAGIFEIGASETAGDAQGAASVKDDRVGVTSESSQPAGKSEKQPDATPRTAGSKKDTGNGDPKGTGGKSAGTGEKPAVRKKASRGKKGSK